MQLFFFLDAIFLFSNPNTIFFLLLPNRKKQKQSPHPLLAGFFKKGNGDNCLCFLVVLQQLSHKVKCKYFPYKDMGKAVIWYIITYSVLDFN